MPRLLRIAALLSIVALLAAGCGGGDDDAKSTTAAQPAASPSSTGAPASTAAAAPADAGSVLAGASVQATGPVHSTLTLKALFEGTPTDAMLGAFLTGPIEVKLDGTADAATKQADVAIEAKAGALNINGRILSDGTNSWIGLGDTFYSLPAGSTGTTGGVDPTALSAAFGSPADYLTDPQVVGTEDVEGIKASHIRGAVDIARLGDALGNVGQAVSGSGLGAALGSTDTTTSSIDTAGLEQAVKSATADVWVAEDSGNVVRIALDLDIAIPEDQQAATSGITGAKVQLDVTTVPGDPIQVTAPADPRPADELTQALLGNLLGLGGGNGADGLGGALG